MSFKPTIEIPLFLSTIGFMLTMSVNNNLLLDRTCYALLHENKTECALLGIVSNNITEKLEKDVEPISDQISLVKNIVDSVLSSVLCLFIAPWSDRFGRKPILVVGLLGGTMSMGLHIVFAAIDTLTPWFILVLSLPVLLTGGSATFMTVLSAYLTDTTTKEERGFRMGVFDIVMTCAVLLGNTASSYILVATSYVMVYTISGILHVLALVFTIFFIPESLREREYENKIYGLLKLSNISEMFRTPFKERELSNKKILLLMMLCLCVGNFAMGGGAMMFYFLRAKFHWTLIQFTWFSSATSILGIAGTFLVIYVLHTLLKIRESLIIFTGTIFSVASLILTGLANKDWHIYLAASLNLPSSGQNAMTRSLMSKLVMEDEIAKVFSVLSITSSILGPISSIIYTSLYNQTLTSDPGLFNFVSAGVSSIGIFIYLAILIIEKKSSRPGYTVLESENVDVAATHSNSINAETPLLK
ncbi:putative peptidoglycan muropeptide transporter SLC46 isoform X1 [Rhynchophorus ferrugineus]|uniref:putative peptidoglycan muropeptide transporter SLC46 isoform X1 n=1 Tax=Rhynchophorus ferrugineus TaxID=354439 RepID=UPI003FCEDBE5